MHTELHLYGLGNFSNADYWSSSEVSLITAYEQSFDGGSQAPDAKNDTIYVRACRAFTSTTNYNLRDTGPGGGLVFWKSSNDYLEAAPTDQSTFQAWSNVTNVKTGATGTAIGTGRTNTDLIINQTGHISSAAKICNDIVIVP
jgi:hypothetical protein